MNTFSAKFGVRYEEKDGAGQGATVEVPGGWRATGRCEHDSAERGDGEAVYSRWVEVPGGWRAMGQ